MCRHKFKDNIITLRVKQHALLVVLQLLFPKQLVGNIPYQLSKFLLCRGISILEFGQDRQEVGYSLSCLAVTGRVKDQNESCGKDGKSHAQILGGVSDEGSPAPVLGHLDHMAAAHQIQIDFEWHAEGGIHDVLAEVHDVHLIVEILQDPDHLEQTTSG